MAIPSLVVMFCLIERRGWECWWSEVGEIFFVGKKRLGWLLLNATSLGRYVEGKTYMYNECQRGQLIRFHALPFMKCESLFLHKI
jgi:hypothetical protein